MRQKNVHFHSWGVWSETETLTFHAPCNVKQINYAVVELEGNGDAIEAK